MNWLNLTVGIIHAPQYVGSEPVQRATWLNLSVYCAEQENGGTIKGCREWKDRRWQQTCGVTQDEVAQDCELWSWSDGNLTVWGYPVEKEAEVKLDRENGRKGGKSHSQSKSESARKNGAKGGRPSGNPSQNPSQIENNPSQNPTERKGKEGNGIGKEEKRNIGTFVPPTIEQVRSFAPMKGLNEAEADLYFHSRNSSGWTRGSAGGGTPRQITSWQSDMASSVGWIKEQCAKSKQPNGKQHRAGEYHEPDIPLPIFNP